MFFDLIEKKKWFGFKSIRYCDSFVLIFEFRFD